MGLAYAFLNFDKQLQKQKILDRKLASELTLEQTNLKKDDLIKKMIKYIEFQVGDKNAESNLKNLLEVFSLMIQNSSAIEEIQDVFNNNNAMEMVLFLLSSVKPLDLAFLKSLMVFCNSMLAKKNSKVQRGVFKHLRAFKQTEKTLARLTSFISGTTTRIKEPKRSFDMEEDTQICLEVLRFICACCEGHYTEMQDYFRVQPNLSIQFNFLKEVVDLLNALSSQVYQKNYDLLILSFDSLIELVQGPNKANQDFLLKSSILEILSKFLMYSYPANRTQRGKDKYATNLLEPYQVRKLKYKSVVLLQATCELIDSPEAVYGRLSKFFPIFLMLIFLEEAYILYEYTYGLTLTSRALNNYSDETIENRERNHQIYLPIEGAFYLFFVMKEILKRGFYDKEMIGDYTFILLDRINVVKASKDKGAIYDSVMNIWNIIKMITLLFIDIFRLISYLFHSCRRRRNTNAVAAVGGSSEADDYFIMISKLKNVKEQAFYTRFEKVLRFYDSNSASIEISHNERIYYLPFIYMPYFSYLPKENKNEFNDKVDRSSRESKVRSLIFDWLRFISSAKYTYLVDKTVKGVHFIRVFYEYFNSITLMNFMVGITINILILIAYSITTDPKQLFDGINTLAWVSIGITSLTMILIGIENIPEVKDFVTRPCTVWEKVYNLVGLVVHSGMLYYMLYMTSTFFGLYFHVYFHAFALSDCINRFPTMKIIFRAIHQPRKSLMLTLFLIIIMCYVAALIWYSIMAVVLGNVALTWPDYIPPLAPTDTQQRFPTPYQNSTPDLPQEPDADNSYDPQYCCVNMLLCFVCLIDNLIKNDAKIATTLAGGHFQRAYQPDYTIFFYDSIALIILKLLLLEILAGLIIDTFGALRDLDISKMEDLKGSCFICGLPVEEFEKPGCANFDTHISKEHYMWNYICYLGYLNDKEPNDYDGIEQYISRQMANSSISWIPNGKTLFLSQETSENIVFDNLDRTDRYVEDIQTSLTRLRQIVSNIEQETVHRKNDKKRIIENEEQMSPGGNET